MGALANGAGRWPDGSASHRNLRMTLPIRSENFLESPENTSYARRIKGDNGGENAGSATSGNKGLRGRWRLTARLQWIVDFRR